MYISTWVKDIFYAALIAVFFLLFKGFIFNSADQTEPLILIYKNLNPDLFQGDFYVEAAKDVFTVRFFYITLLTFLGTYFSLYSVSLFFTLLCLFVSVLGFIHISRILTNGQITGYLVPFFVLFLFISWTVGGNVIQYHLLIASSFAKALSIWGIYFILKEKWKLSALLIGVGGLFQVLVGLQLGVVFITILLLTKKWKALMEWSVFWLIAIGPMLIPILYRQFFMPQPIDVDIEAYYRILYEFKNPHHYLPSLFPWTAYVKLLILVITAWIIGWWFLQKKSFTQVSIFISVIILGLIFYSVVIELLEVKNIGKIQWFKTTIWLQAIAALILGISFEYILRQLFSKKYLWFFGVLFPILWILRGHFVYDAPLALDHRTDKQKDLEKLHLWIKDNTPQNALFSTYLSDESFSCEAHRPVTSMIVPIVHEPWYMIQWYRHFYNQYGVNESVIDLSEKRNLAEQYYESGQWQEVVNSDYAVMRKNIELSHYSKVYETEFYQLMKRNKN